MLFHFSCASVRIVVENRIQNKYVPSDCPCTCIRGISWDEVGGRGLAIALGEVGTAFLRRVMNAFEGETGCCGAPDDELDGILEAMASCSKRLDNSEQWRKSIAYITLRIIVEFMCK